MVVDNECVNCLENQMAYYGRCFSCGLDEVIQADNVSYPFARKGYLRYRIWAKISKIKNISLAHPRHAI